MNTPRDIRFDLPEINTWRLCNKGIDQETIEAMVNRWETQGYRFGAVCIDDGWQADGLMGEWNACPQRFANPARLAEWIHRKGYALRVWVAPCQVHPDTPIFKRAWPDALMKDAQGRPCFYRGLGTYTLDIRSTLAQDHIRNVMRHVHAQWGMDAVKLDFPPFYTPDDDYYKMRGYDLSEEDKQAMGGHFHALVREGLDSAAPGIRVESYSHCPGAEPYIQDVITGDLVGQERTWETLLALALRARQFIGDRDITPWFEMVWGSGSDTPMNNPAWHVGFLEYIAGSINFNFKIEHSFLPFDYPNAHQIRALTNLYGPRDPGLKVIYAGNRAFNVSDMIQAGVQVDARTRFLIAPENDTMVEMNVTGLSTNALYFKCRDLTTGALVNVRSRNEFWRGDTSCCFVQVDAQKHHVYELFYTGDPTGYFQRIWDTHGLRRGEAALPAQA
jgi:hypothetical protein